MLPILWIEDSALQENTILATPVHLAGKYDLILALSATEGLIKLTEREYAAVVVDIRIPPGDDDRWINMYYSLGGTNKAARLGLKLLEVVLGPPDEYWRDELSATARDSGRYGVLSVEGASELARELEPFGVAVCRDKGGGDDPDVLLTVIEEILKRGLRGS